MSERLCEVEGCLHGEKLQIIRELHEEFFGEKCSLEQAQLIWEVMDEDERKQKGLRI
jgi:hypothetical protein